MVINLFGLSFGILIFFFIIFWVKDELIYDCFYENVDDVVCVLCEFRFEDGILNWVMLSIFWLLVLVVKMEILGIKEVVRIWIGG